MNSSVAVTLIIVGVVLILAPLVGGYLLVAHMSPYLFGPNGVGSGHFAAMHRQHHFHPYLWLCIILGLICLFTGIARSKPTAAPLAH
jgi:hypothetical protein